MGGDFYTPYTFTHTPYTFVHTPYIFTRTPYTITAMVTAPKIKKALVLRMLLGIKKTETPIFQGISVILPKLYLGGRSDRSRNIDSTH